MRDIDQHHALLTEFGNTTTEPAPDLFIGGEAHRAWEVHVDASRSGMLVIARTRHALLSPLCIGLHLEATALRSLLDVRVKRLAK